MSPQIWGDLLALLNAALNLTSAVCLVAGVVFIRRRQVRRHRAAMLTALAASGLFLVSYLTRVGLSGTHHLAAGGAAHAIYMAILITHMILAATLAPLVLRLLFLVRRRRFRAHAGLARWVFPAWLYVSLTGIAVYLMLYHIFGYA